MADKRGVLLVVIVHRARAGTLVVGEIIPLGFAAMY
jgi:hypothetical protein